MADAASFPAPPSPRRLAAAAILALFIALHAVAKPDPPCDPKLIPRQILFGNPDRAWPQISPDGSKLAYLAPVEGLMNVLVAARDEPLRAAPVTHDRKRGIRQYYWAFSNRHLVYLQDEAGDENWHVFVADIETGVTKDVTPLKGVQARIQEISPRFRPRFWSPSTTATRAFMTFIASTCSPASARSSSRTIVTSSAS